MSATRRSDALRLAGEPAFRHADGRVEAIEQKDALLFAYLAIEGPTPRRTLATLLWPDVEAERGRANLRQRLFRLRKALGRDILEGGEVAALCADVEVDLGAADGGVLLPGLDAPAAGGLADWLDAARERRRTGRLAALADETSRLEAAGNLAAALAAAQRLAELDPTSEHAHRRLMRLHYLRGDRAAALAAFDRCCDVLERSLGVAPDAETEALRARVVASSLPTPAMQRPLPVSVLRPPRLIGRDAEWRSLHAAWSQGTAALIAGEGGLGKTRLVEDFARAHPDALLVDARPGDVRVPHALLSRLLRQAMQRLGDRPLAAGVVDELARLLPELGRLVPAGAADGSRFANAVESLLREAVAQGVAGLVVDDLHFADAASVETMQRLAGAGLGLRWVIAFRAAELAPAARAFHDDLVGAGAARLHVLQPLAMPQIGELVASLGVAELEPALLAPLLERHTGGNPLYVLETLKLMLATGAVASTGAREPVPLPAAADVSRLIGQRIGRLSALAIKLSRCAAIAGDDFSAEVAAHVLGLRAIDLADAWAELEAAQVLRDGVFAHDLIREAARASVPVPIARRLHAEVAGFLEGRASEPANVAEHWLAAGEAARALPFLLAAADRAAAAWRPAEEAALLARATRIVRGGGSDARVAFELLQRAHRAHVQSDLASPDHLEVIDALAALARTPLERAYARWAGADTLAQRGDGAGAEAEARAGLAAIGDESGAAADALHIDLTAVLANGLFIQDRPGDGADAVRAVEPRLLGLGDRQREVEHYANLGVLLDAGNRHVEAQSTLRHAIALARAQGDRASELVVLSNLASSLHDVGLVDAALEPLHEIVRIKERYPELRTGAVFVQVQIGNMERALGRYDDALKWLDRGLAILAEYVPTFVAAAHHGLARVWLDLGQFARAQQQLALAQASHALPPMMRAMTHLLRARCALAQGQRAAAGAALAEARGFVIGSTRYAIHAQVELLAGPLRGADEAYPAAIAVAREAGRLQMQGVRIDALCAAARSALIRGDASLAASHAAEALALWPERAPDTLYPGEMWLVAADAFAAAGDARAAETVAAAARWIEDATARVPEPFRASFRERNAANRELLARAARER